VNRVNDFNRRVRDLEEKIRNLNARVNTLDESLLNKTKSLSNDMKDLENEIEEIRDRVANLEVDIKEINREKRKFVSEQQLDEMENYIKLMNPINSSFMTESEVKELIQQRRGVSKNEVEKMIDRKIKNQKSQPDNKENTDLT
jgi:predicted  nucleic acid-binding Zn-ribbon protein